jgi:DNA-3-methyladenine glycosylase II
MSTQNPLHTCTVELVGPLDIPLSLGIFRHWGDDGIDRWDGYRLVRTTRLAGQTIPYACTVLGTIDKPALEITIAQAAHAPAIAALVSRMFITAPGALEALMQIDPVIAQLESRFRGVRPVMQAELFTALVRSITAQQVNLPWATTLRRRLAETFGCRHHLGEHWVIGLVPDRLAAATVADLRALQFSTRKAEYIIGLATAVTEGALDLEALRLASDDEVIARLTALRGLGRWTAEWFLARALGRARVSAGDLGVRKAVAVVYLQGRMPSEIEVRELTAHWGDASGVAQQLVLQALRVEGG